MNHSNRRLDALAIPNPCRVAWSSMAGDDRVRFCGLCRQNVYNLSTMTEAEATALVEAGNGRVCVRFYQRGDGTVVTRDCPGGRRSRRRWLAVATTAAAALVVGYALILTALIDSPNGRRTLAGRARQLPAWVQEIEPVRRFIDWIDPPILMGCPAPPPPNAAPPGTGQPE